MNETGRCPYRGRYAPENLTLGQYAGALAQHEVTALEPSLADFASDNSIGHPSDPDARQTWSRIKKARFALLADAIHRVGIRLEANRAQYGEYGLIEPAPLNGGALSPEIPRPTQVVEGFTGSDPYRQLQTAIETTFNEAIYQEIDETTGHNSDEIDKQNLFHLGDLLKYGKNHGFLHSTEPRALIRAGAQTAAEVYAQIARLAPVLHERIFGSIPTPDEAASLFEGSYGLISELYKQRVDQMMRNFEGLKERVKRVKYDRLDPAWFTIVDGRIDLTDEGRAQQDVSPAVTNAVRFSGEEEMRCPASVPIVDLDLTLIDPEDPESGYISGEIQAQSSVVDQTFTWISGVIRKIYEQEYLKTGTIVNLQDYQIGSHDEFSEVQTASAAD